MQYSRVMCRFILFFFNNFPFPGSLPPMEVLEKNNIKTVLHFAKVGRRHTQIDGRRNTKTDSHKQINISLYWQR